MTNYTTKTLILTLLTLWLGIFGVSPGYALTLIQAQKLLASDSAEGDNFGFSVSIAGDTAVIGAYRDDDNGTSSGSAYIFVRNGSEWSEQQKLTASSDGAAFDSFGRSVSIAGDTAVIGAYQDDDDDNGTSSGSAYVFVRDGAGMWTQQQKLTASDGAALDLFGRSVSISGDTAVIGAHRDDEDGTDSGSVYVFVRNGSEWSEQQKLTAGDGALGDNFGISVSIAGDTAVIGAHRDDDNGASSGSVYVFVRNGSEWSEQQKLTASSDGAAFDEFGFSVSIAGDTAVIGTQGDDDNGSSSGSAYVFVRDGAGMWTQQQKLTASDGAAFDLFGRSVSISRDTAIIGAQFEDDNGSSSGSAYVFVRDGAGMWTQQQKLTASDGAASDFLGASVSIAGDTAVIGAYQDDDDGDDSGSAYVFVSNDSDGDGILDEVDNCPTVSNPFQTDSNGDGFGDACVSPDVNISSNANVAPDVTIDSGSTINKGVTLQSGVQIGAGVTLNKDATVGENTVVGNNTAINRSVTIGSDIVIGESVTIEKNVTIGNGVTIGDNTIIKKGTVIEANAIVGMNVFLGTDVIVKATANVADNTIVPKGTVVMP